MPLITFEICRVPIVVTASAQLISAIADYFRYYHPRLITSSFAAPQSVLTISLQLCASPPAASASAEAEMLSQWEVMQLWRRPQTGTEPERFELRTPDALISIEPEAGRARGQLTPQAIEVAHTLAYMATLLLLRTRGIYHLHAAGVLSPEGELFVICGEPRAGKTTLATALGLAGWNPIADDALLIYEAESGAELSAVRRSFHLSNDILARWPKLDEMLRHQRTPQRTWASGLEFFDTLRLAETAFNRIDCILLPQLSNAERTRTEPVSLSQALLRLAQQSMFFQLWPEQTKQQVKLLTALAGKAICQRFLAGREILADPRRAAQALRFR
jgi:hypothetical protein